MAFTQLNNWKHVLETLLSFSAVKSGFSRYLAITAIFDSGIVSIYRYKILSMKSSGLANIY